MTVDDTVMSRRYNQKPPVKPIGKILYHEYIHDHWFHQKPGNRDKVQPPLTYERVCDCKGFSDDRPFSVFFHQDPKDKKPFKVVFQWTNEKYKSFKFKYAGSDRSEIDSDTYHMLDVLEEHATKSAAQTAMRRFAKEAFAKVNYPPQQVGEECYNVWFDGTGVVGEERPLHLGDLVEYVSCPGIVWRIVGERRTTHDWSLRVEPVFSFLVSNNTNKSKEISQRDVYNYVRPIDLVKLGSAYMQLGNVLKDEAKRLSIDP